MKPVPRRAWLANAGEETEESGQSLSSVQQNAEVADSHLRLRARSRMGVTVPIGVSPRLA